MSKKFRPNVAAIVVNGEGLVLACERSDIRGAWQFPQGGIEPGESPAEALIRELGEEIGASQVEILGMLPDPLEYEWPAEQRFESVTYCGQRQHYFLVRIDENDERQLSSFVSDEFSAFEWITVQEFTSRVSGFKSEVYIRALHEVHRMFPGILNW